MKYTIIKRKRLIMNSSIKLTIALAFTVIISSCSNNNDEEVINSKEIISVEIESRYNRNEMLQMIYTIGNKLEKCTRSDGTVSITEADASAMLKPLVEDGKQIQASMIKQIKDNSLAYSDEIEYVSSFSDSELASLSFIVAVCTEPHDVNIDGQMGYAITIETFNTYIRPCIVSALGVQNIKSIINTILVKGGVSTTELLPLLKIIGKRYVAYTALAFFIWDTVDCLHNNGFI